MKKFFLSLLLMFCALQSSLPAFELNECFDDENKIVKATKRIYLSACPGAYNPSIIQFNDGYLLTFRYLPNRSEESWISYIGIIHLNKSFDPISKIQLLDTRLYNSSTPSQSEDARIFSCNNRLYVVYNDNMDLVFPSTWERRDMYIAELVYDGRKFIVGEPLKLVHETKYRQSPWQKNWSPFEWNGSLLFSYMISPHEVIIPDMETGICSPFCMTHKPIMWRHGMIRGGTPAELVDGEYLAFFHSGIITSSLSSDNQDFWHYFMGAYTFSAEPPFEITGISQDPIDAPGFYTYSNYNKRVIYPGGFIVDGENVYVAYGKDDTEVWIATMDLTGLKKSMKRFQ